MSAFMVSNDTINTISVMTGIGAQALIDMNARAIRARYGTDEGWQAHGEGASVGLPTLAKMLGCYLYQCSEGNVPDEPLYKTLDIVAESLLERFQHTKEYKEAAWG